MLLQVCVTAVAAHSYASFEGFSCLLSIQLFLPATCLVFTMRLVRGHLPLALLALGLSGSKCMVIGALQPQRDNLFGFYNLSGVRTMNLLHLSMHSRLSWPLLLAVGFRQLLAMPRNAECFGSSQHVVSSESGSCLGWIDIGVQVELTLTPSS